MSWKTLFGKPIGVNGAQRHLQAQSEPMLDPHALLQSHHAQLNTLRLECGYEVSQFRQLIEAPILQVAHWVHALPATQSAHHCEPGGLLRLSIESAAAAFRRSDGRFLGCDGEATMRDRDRERLLRYLALLGAVLRAVGDCATQAQVEVPSIRATWNPWCEGLWPWRRRTGGALVLRWSEEITDIAIRDRASVWIASRLLPPQVLEHLHAADRSLPMTLLAIVGGAQASAVATLVEEARQAVIEQDLSKRSHRIEPTPVSAPTEHHLLDAMRVLGRQKWQVNTPSAVVWCTDQGVYLDWALACADLFIRLRAAGVTSLPQDPNALAELLLAQGLLIASTAADAGLRHLYRIHVQARGMARRAVLAVKIAQPERIGLHLDGVDRIALQSDSSTVGRMVAEPSINVAPHVQLPLVDHAGGVLTSVEADSHQPPIHSAAEAATPSSMHPGVESPLRRFGTAAAALQTLAELLRSQSPRLAVSRTQEGLAIGYPDSVALLGSTPEAFVSACEAQGLLVPERAGGRKFVRLAPLGRDDLPRQYIVLAPRVLKYLGVECAGS